MRKVINVSKEPFDFTFDSGNYGPYRPGEIVELPDHLAAHAVKRSVINDDEGNPVDYKMAYLSDVKSRGDLDGIATYKCPWIERDECTATPFQTPDALRAHIDTHLPKGRVAINSAAARP